MRRSNGQSRPVHHRARLGAAVGALAVVLLLGSCGAEPVTPAAPSPTPTPSASPASPSTVPTPTSSSARPSATPTPLPTSVSPSPPVAAPPATTAAPSPSKTTAAPTPTTTKPSTTKPPATTPTTVRPTTSTPTTSTTTPSASRLVQIWAGQDIEAFDTGRKVVALTFDGGASADAVQSILTTLDDYDVPATFFVTGAFARAYPRSVAAMDAAGHPVGNHSDTHPYFTETTNEAIRAELAAAEREITALTGTTTKPLFRFPYGDRAALDIRVVNEAGYIPIRWTVDTLGWKGTSGGITTAIVRQRILDTLRPGQIVLMHVGAHPDDHSTLDADALPGIIEDLKSRGYGFTTLPDLLDDAL